MKGPTSMKRLATAAAGISPASARPCATAVSAMIRVATDSAFTIMVADAHAE